MYTSKESIQAKRVQNIAYRVHHTYKQVLYDYKGEALNTYLYVLLYIKTMVLISSSPFFSEALRKQTLIASIATVAHAIP